MEYLYLLMFAVGLIVIIVLTVLVMKDMGIID